MSSRLCLTMLCFGLALHGISSAQEEKGPEQDDAPTRPTSRDAEVRGMYMLDEEGELVWVPDVTWEELQAWRDRKKSAAPPTYEIKEASLTGSLENRTAIFDVSLKVSVPKKSDDVANWVRIPLLLDGAVMQSFEPASVPNVRLHTDATSSGYVCWIRQSETKEHVLKLKVAVRVDDVDAASAIQLRLPRVFQEAKIDMQLPPDMELRARGNQRVLQVEPRLADGKLLASTSFAGGVLELEWSKSDPMHQAVQRPLEVNSRITYEIDDPQTVRASVVLQLLNAAGVDEFLVKLPAEMELKRATNTFEAPYEIETVPPEEAPNQNASYVRVRVRRPFANEASVRMETILVSDKESGNGTRRLQLGGFEVVGAAPQQGDVEVLSNDDYALEWTHPRQVQRHAVNGKVSSKRVAKFHFDRHPFKLQAVIRSKPRDVRVEPQIELVVDENGVRQQATLKYEVRGAPATSVEINAPGWELVHVGPRETVENSQATNGRIVAELTPAAQNRKSFTIEVSARLPLPDGEDELQLVTIQPQENRVAPAKVSLEAMGNVVVRPDLAKMTSMVIDVDDLRDGDNQWSFQQGSFSSDAIVHLMVERLQKQNTATLDHRIACQGTKANVALKWELNVEAETISTLSFFVPQELQSRSTLPTFTIVEQEDSQPLVLTVDDARSGLWVLQLPETVPSGTTIQCEYVLPMEASSDTDVDDVDWIVPLVVLRDEDVQVLAASSAIDIQHEATNVVVVDGLDLTAKSNVDGSLATTSLPIAAKSTDVSFVTRVDEDSGAGAIVQHTWTQTTIVPSGRRDRVVFRLAGASSDLLVRLPSTAREDSAQVIVDGVRRRHVVDAGVLRLEEPLRDANTEHVIELWYESNAPEGVWATLVLDTPRILGANYEEFGCWQIVMPRSQHLGFLPSELNANHTWQWRGLFWGYQCALTDTELEQRANSTHQEGLSRASANRYLFETRGPLPRTEVVVVSRYIVVWLASGLVVLVGLILIRMPRLIHPVTGLLAGVLLLCLAQILPEQTVLIAQAAVLGFVLACVSYACYWYARSGQDDVFVHSRTQPEDDSISVEVSGSYIESDSRASTATAPTHLRLPATTDSHAQ